MRWTRSLVAVVVASVASVAPAYGQTEPPDQPAVDRPAEHRTNRRETRRREIWEKIEVIRISRLMDELDLDPETAVRLVPLLSRMDALERARREKTARFGRELSAMTRDEAVDDAALAQAMDHWWDEEEAHLKARRALFDELGGVLTAWQQARLVVFIPRFRRQMRRLAQELRHRPDGADTHFPGGRRHRPGNESRPDRDAWLEPAVGER